MTVVHHASPLPGLARVYVDDEINDPYMAATYKPEARFKVYLAVPERPGEPRLIAHTDSLVKAIAVADVVHTTFQFTVDLLDYRLRTAMHDLLLKPVGTV